MLLTGETIIPEGLFLTGLQAVEKFIEICIFFTPIVDRLEPIFQRSCAFPMHFFCQFIGSHFLFSFLMKECRVLYYLVKISLVFSFALAYLSAVMSIRF